MLAIYIGVGLFMFGSTVLRKEGKHYKHQNLEFWAEEGVICIIDDRDNSYNALTCAEFGKRAKLLNDEAKRATWQDERDALNNAVLLMYESWKEAKSQGDPTDPEIMRQKLKERRRAVLILGSNY